MRSLKLDNVRKSFGKVEVIKGVDLEVEEGEFVVFVGPSGCGKSTLLRIIAGLEDLTDGHVLMGDEIVDNVPPSKRGLAMVFQSYALYPHLTVRGNMRLGLKQAKMPSAEIAERVKRAAEMLHLEELLERRPAELSGGQRQRVAIGRAIVREPKLFLFDEPLSNLDAALRVNTRLEIANLHRVLGSTIIYVTHDQVEAMTLADKIVVLNEGRIEQVGRPIDLYRTPANRFVAGFIGSPKMNFVEGAAAERFNANSIGVRPEHMTITDVDAIWAGNVNHIERLGSDTFIYVNTADSGLLTIRVPGEIAFEVGDHVGLFAEDQMVYRFDKSGAAIRAG